MKLLSSFYLLATFSLLSLTDIQAQSNQYLHFDGVDDFAMTENAAQYVAGADGVSMTGWFYTDALVYGQGMIGIRGGGDGDGEMYVIQLSDGVLECRYISTAGFHEVVGPAGSAQAGTWQHLAWVYDGSSIELFIDGVPVGNNNASGVFESLDRPLGIGKSIQSGFNFVFGGRVDEVTLWSKGLTQVEIMDLMTNELEGNENGLELYYKMNQGVPGANNTSISELISEVGGGTRNAQLMNFSLTGETSNFNGVLSDGFQSISFPQIPNKLINDDPFELNASANSGLPIAYTIISGPASVSGSTLTLDGVAGQVIVQAAQEGNDVFDPAAEVQVAFDVVDPAVEVPNINLRNPVGGDFIAPDLTPILLASIIEVDYPELFELTDIIYQVDGSTVDITDYGNGHQTAWWTPSSYGEHTFSVSATHSAGGTNTESVTFNIVASGSNETVAAFTDVWADSDDFAVEVEGVLPSYVGAFNEILGTLDIGCPPGGCDPWDRVSSIEARGHNGEWYEIIRYITPYGVACQHEIDLTDFMSLLQGKVRFRVNLGTQGNGFLYTLTLDYDDGTPDHAYSTVEKLWYQTYAFGDIANLQPTEDFFAHFPGNTEAAKVKLVSTGHGWGELNSGNAAEFHEDTHHIWVNNEETFEQHNWNICNPNPDGCSPQNGTWYFPRAGWCPGSIAQWFDYEMDDYLNGLPVHLDYVFDTEYQDFCHPNNPNCVTGITCADCDAGFNPHLIVSSYLVSFSSTPLGTTEITTGVEEQAIEREIPIHLFPNPSSGRFEISSGMMMDDVTVLVTDQLGKRVFSSSSQHSIDRIIIDLGPVESGIYVVTLLSEQGSSTKKLVIE